MTHTLHPEIEKAVTELAESVANEIYKVPTPAGIDFVKGVIKDELWPYLNMPQPIENEPLPEKDDEFVKQFVEDAEHEIIEKHFEAEFLDWEPVVEWRSMLEAKSILHYIKENYVFKEEQKQSTPQIEKMKIHKLWWEVMLTRDMTIEKINEIIDYINNNLPTSKDA